MRLNVWVSIVVFLASTGFFVWWQFLRGRPAAGRGARRPKPRAAAAAMAIPKGRVRPGR